jgi:hypothetical protein
MCGSSQESFYKENHEALVDLSGFQQHLFKRLFFLIESLWPFVGNQ